jgi:hypothetical protein
MERGSEAAGGVRTSPRLTTLADADYIVQRHDKLDTPSRHIPTSSSKVGLTRIEVMITAPLTESCFKSCAPFD